jgi:Arylsulfatase A and related enzymes
MNFVKIPLIVYDPSEAADATRGTTCDELVEAIDCAATFIEAAGGEVPQHIVEGRSLLPFLHGQEVDDWREYAISEYDFSSTIMAKNLGLVPKDSRLFMVADKRWKFMHAEGGFRPMLFDLENDPNELTDLGTDPAYSDTIALMYERLAKWARRMSQRVTKSDQDIIQSRGASRRKGILLGLYDGTEIDELALSRYHGRAEVDYTKN